MLVRELPNARLVEAGSILELRLSPERLTGEIVPLRGGVLAGRAGRQAAPARKAATARAAPDARGTHYSSAVSSRKEQKEKLRREREEREQAAKAAERRAAAGRLRRGRGARAGGDRGRRRGAARRRRGRRRAATARGDVFPDGGKAPEQQVDGLRVRRSRTPAASEGLQGQQPRPHPEPLRPGQVQDQPADLRQALRRPRPTTAPTARRRTDEELVHSQEHGRVIIWFKPSLPKEARADLRALFDEDQYQMVLVPERPTCPTQVAVTRVERRPGAARHRPPDGVPALQRPRSSTPAGVPRRVPRQAAPSRSRSRRRSLQPALLTPCSALVSVACNVLAVTMMRSSLAPLVALVVSPPRRSRCSRYQPEPVDFELAPGRPARWPRRRAARWSRGRCARRSASTSSGLRWRGRAEPRVAIRVRKAGGRWSRWARLSTEQQDGPDPGTRRGRRRAASAPLWVGRGRLGPVPADAGACRGCGSTSSTSSGTATARRPAAHRDPAARQRGACGARRALGASAAPPSAQPAMVMRDDWGASDCPPRSGAQLRRGEGRVRPPHGEPRTTTRARRRRTIVLGDLPLPPQLERVERHRLQLPRRQVRHALRGPCRRDRPAGGRRPGPGLQRARAPASPTSAPTPSVPQTPGGAATRWRALIRWKLPLHGAPPRARTTLKSAGRRHQPLPVGQRRSRVDRVIGHRDTTPPSARATMLYGQLTELRRDGGRPVAVPVLEAPPSRARTAMAAALAPRWSATGGAVRGERAAAQGRWQSPRQQAGGGADAARPHLAHRRASSRPAGTGRFSVLLRPKVTRLVRARFRGNGTLRASARRRCS